MSWEEPIEGHLPSPAFQTRRHAPREPGDNPGPNLEQPDGLQSHSAIVSLCDLPLPQPLPPILPHVGTGPGGPQAPCQLSAAYPLSSPVCIITAPNFSGARPALGSAEVNSASAVLGAEKLNGSLAFQELN